MGTFRQAQEEHLRKMMSGACCWGIINTGGVHHSNDCKSGIDPNDLQATCDHRKFDPATDSCAICGKDWNTILWYGNGSKPCCGGNNGPGPYFYSGGAWHATDCDSLKPPMAIPEHVGQSSVDYRPKPSYRCQCGAQATSNPNCHSTWCPDYKK